LTKPPVRQIAAIAADANAVFAFASEHGADFDFLDPGAVNALALISSISSLAFVNNSFGFVGL